jgi:hypothetical protein
MIKDQSILVSVPVIFRKDGDKVRWFIVKAQPESNWELPKVIVRKAESSVRASIRSVSEQGGMRAQVYEEVGRQGGATKVNGQAVSQRFIYYLLMHKGGAEEVLEFSASDWVDFSTAKKKLESKRDQNMLDDANTMMKKLQKEGRFDKTQEEQDAEDAEFE